MKKFLILFLVFISIKTIDAQNNFLVRYEKINSYSKDELKAKWKENKIKEFISPVRYGVDVYEIMYKTRWHDGSEILASGFYYIPQNNSDALPIMVMNHGTTLKKEIDE